MTNLKTISFLFAAAAGTNLIAQDLDAQVVQDPNAGLAIYTATVQGPPGGLAFPFVSFLQTNPIPFPNVFGNLLIDPGLSLNLPFLSLNNQGLGALNIQGPFAVTNGLPLFFQAVVVDPWNNNQLAFTDFGCAVPRFVQPANPALPPAMFQTKYNNGVLRVDFTLGPPNANITVWVNGGQKATGYLVLDANGQGSVQVQIPGGMQHGDDVQVLVNGTPMLNYNH